MPKVLDRCLQHLKAKGMSEDSAYAICVTSTGSKRKKGGGWTKPKKKSATFNDSLKRRKE